MDFYPPPACCRGRKNYSSEMGPSHMLLIKVGSSFALCGNLLFTSWNITVTILCQLGEGFFPSNWIGVIYSSWTNPCLSTSSLSSVTLFHILALWRLVRKAVLIEVKADSLLAWSQSILGKNLQDLFSQRSVNDSSWHMQLIFMFYWMG